MKKMILAMVLTFAAGSVFAGAKEDKFKDAALKEIADVKPTMTTKCGSKIEVKLDDATIPSFMKADRSPGGYCKQAMDGFESACEDATYKAAVAKKVKKLNCKLASKDDYPVEFKFDEKSGALDVGLSPKSGEVQSQTKKFLEDNM